MRLLHRILHQVFELRHRAKNLVETDGGQSGLPLAIQRVPVPPYLEPTLILELTDQELLTRIDPCNLTQPPPQSGVSRDGHGSCQLRNHLGPGLTEQLDHLFDTAIDIYHSSGALVASKGCAA
jgi:hypothetical protein